MKYQIKPLQSAQNKNICLHRKMVYSLNPNCLLHFHRISFDFITFVDFKSKKINAVSQSKLIYIVNVNVNYLRIASNFSCNLL